MQFNKPSINKRGCMQPMLHKLLGGASVKQDPALTVWQDRDDSHGGRWTPEAGKTAQQRGAGTSSFFSKEPKALPQAATWWREGNRQKWRLLNERLSAGFLKWNENNRKKSSSRNRWGTPAGRADWCRRIRRSSLRGPCCPSFDSKCQSALGSQFLPYSNFGFWSNIYYSRNSGVPR